jgi:hypothetical protein
MPPLQRISTFRHGAASRPATVPRAAISRLTSRSDACTAHLANLTATLGAAATAWAYSRAAGSTLWSCSCRSAMPRATAWQPVIGREVRMRSKARSGPINSRSRSHPPRSGTTPLSTSGRPKIALPETMRTSHARASSQPAPRAIPLTAAMTGTGTLVGHRNASRSSPTSGVVENASQKMLTLGTAASLVGISVSTQPMPLQPGIAVTCNRSGRIRMPMPVSWNDPTDIRAS